MSTKPMKDLTDTELGVSLGMPGDKTPEDFIVEKMRASNDPYFRALGDMAALKLERGRQYNQGGVALKDYFPFGRRSYFQMVWVKTLRAKANLDGRKGVWLDSLRDLVNYAIFAVCAEEEDDEDL